MKYDWRRVFGYSKRGAVPPMTRRKGKNLAAERALARQRIQPMTFERARHLSRLLGHPPRGRHQ
jgi:hypothetical protein